jgi:hypothetical protein
MVAAPPGAAVLRNERPAQLADQIQPTLELVRVAVPGRLQRFIAFLGRKAV